MLSLTPHTTEVVRQDSNLYPLNLVNNPIKYLLQLSFIKIINLIRISLTMNILVRYIHNTSASNQLAFVFPTPCLIRTLEGWHSWLDSNQQIVESKSTALPFGYTSIWSEWRDSNSRPRHTKCRVLSAELHPDIGLFIYLRRLLLKWHCGSTKKVKGYPLFDKYWRPTK